MILYILNEDETCTYKIGFTTSKNANHRVKTLQTGCKNKINIIWEFEHPKANIIERMMHRNYAWCRLTGEWFNFENVNIEDVKTKAIGFADVLKLLDYEENSNRY